jgi:heme O synthase-like polyprenyltransferase
MSVTPWLIQFAQDPANAPITIVLQVIVILLGVVLLIQAEMLTVGHPRNKVPMAVFYFGILPLFITFLVIIVARFLRIIF